MRSGVKDEERGEGVDCWPSTSIVSIKLKIRVGDERAYLRSEVYTSNLGQFYQLVKSLLVAKVVQGKFLKEELEVYQYLKRGSILFHLRSKNLKNKIQVLL